VWSNEFEDARHSDPAQWRYEKGHFRREEPQYYAVKRLVSARSDGETLIIELGKEEPDKFPWADPIKPLRRFEGGAVDGGGFPTQV
jgi:hypothetical protein